MSIVTHVALIGLAIVVAISFIIVNLLSLKFTKWSAQQYSVLVLLLGLILYNCTSVALWYDLLISDKEKAWILLLNAVSQTSLFSVYATLLNLLLIFLHGLYIAPESRTFVRFYLPKIVFMLLLFVLHFLSDLFLVHIGSIVGNSTGVAQTIAISVPRVTLVVLYIIVAVYYIVQAVRNKAKITLNFGIVYGSVVAFLLWPLLVDIIRALTFGMGLKYNSLLISHTLRYSIQFGSNLYLILLAVLFTCTRSKQTATIEVEPLVADIQ